MNKEKPNARVTKKELSYIEKVWHTVAIVALLVAVILVARVAFNVLLMGLAGALIATYFHGLGDIIQRKTKMRRRFAMVISIIGTFILVSALLWFMGSKIETQVNQLSAGLPHTISNVKAQMAKTSLGQKVLSGLEDDDSQKKLLTTAQDFFSTTFGVWAKYILYCSWGYFLRPTRRYTKTAYYY
jgi:predicted PurR-regulated permease PerM